MFTSKEVKEYAKKHGADLVGITSMDRFEGAPKEMDPRYIMPEAKAMVVLAFRILRGCLRGIEEGTNFISYSSMGYAGLNYVYIPMTLWNICKFIEDKGYEAFPYLNPTHWVNIDHIIGGARKEYSVPVSPDRPAPDVFVHFRIAAYAAGLGEIGWSKVFLTPEFGPRQRFAILLTDAPLEPDPIYNGPPLCDKCMLCAKGCSENAISRTEAIKIKVAGRNIEWGKLDGKKCLRGFSGNNLNLGATIEETAPSPYNPFLQKLKPIYQHGEALEGARGCIRECMIHLEEQGKIKSKFKESFRRRKPWKIIW